MNKKRIAIIGPPGSGKSTLACKLGKMLNVPVHHLDRYVFEPDGKKKNKQAFIELQKELLSKEGWVVEGCSFSTFELRFAKAEVMIYLNFSALKCISRLCKRIFNYEKKFGGLRAINWQILKYTWTFDKEKRQRIEELKNKYPEVYFKEFQCQKEADNYLTRLCNIFGRRC